MSHTIFYRAMFLKMSDGTFIPFIESGDNNVWDAGRNRRSRDWESCRWIFESESQRNRISLTEQEIMDSAQKEIDLGGQDCIKLSGHSGWGTPAQFLAFFRSGFRHAVTFDDLRENCCNVRLSWWKEGNYDFTVAATEEELLRKWNECLGKGFQPYVCLDAFAERVWNEMKLRTHRERKRTGVDSRRFIVSFSRDGSVQYVQQFTSHHLRFVGYKEYAHRYASRKSAQASVNRISKSYSQTITDARIEELAPVA